MPQLLDRDAELARLHDVFETVRRGDGRVTVISGPAGIGKTALLDEFCAGAAPLATVLRARAGEFEQELSLEVVRQLFAQHLAGLDEGERDRVLAGAAARAADGLGYEGAPIPEAELFHALHWLCANLAAERTLVLAVDDAHFGDVVSLRWLRYLATRIEHLPVMIVMTTEGR